MELLLIIPFLLSLSRLSSAQAPALSPAAVMSEAARLAQDGKYTEAIQAYDSILKSGLGASVPEARHRKGLCLKALRKHQDAVACWEPLVKPGFANLWQEDALLETAKTYAFDLNQPDTALKLYDRYLKDFPAGKWKMEARYQQCGVFYQTGDFKEAKARFESFLKDFPESYLCPEVRRMIALCDERLASTRQAPEASAKPASTQKPAGKLMEDTMAKLERAHVEAEKMFKAGQYEKALKAYQDIRRAFPLSEPDEKALFMTGECLAELGQYDKAAAAWNEVVLKSRGKLDSEYADDSLLALGNLCLEARGEPEKAMAYYEALLEGMPESPLVSKARHQLGLVHFYMGRTSEALAIFEKERESNPQDTNAPPDSLTRLIEACRGERKYTPDFAETPKGRQAATHIRRGDVFFTAKEYEKARKAYEEAERLAPGTEEGGYALMQAARCFTQLKECKKAIDCYKGFLGKYKTSSHAPDALLRMAVVYISHIGDDLSGRKILETIAEDCPNHEKAETAMYYLATLDLWGKRWEQAKIRYLVLMERYPDTEYIPYITNTILPEIEGHTKERRGDADKKE